MKYRSITLLTAALLLTGCTAANQTDPAAELTEQTGVQTEETTGAETDAPITEQSVTQADITMPDLSAIGIDTDTFSPADEPFTRTYGYDEIAYEGDAPTETFTAYCNPEQDRLLFDQSGRLVAYDAHMQTAWHMSPNTAVSGSAAYEESLRTTGPNGETAEAISAAPGSTPGDDFIELDDGRILLSKDAYNAPMLSEDEFRKIADDLLDTVVPEREAFTERDEHILELTASQTFLPCSIGITRRYNDDICDSAYAELDNDGRVMHFSIVYANITDLSVSETLRAKAEAYAEKMYSSNPEIEEISGHCRNIGGTDYGSYTVTFLFGDGYGCDEILVRGD